MGRAGQRNILSWLPASLATLAAAAVLLAIYCCVSKRDAAPEPMEYEGDDR